MVLDVRGDLIRDPAETAGGLVQVRLLPAVAPRTLGHDDDVELASLFLSLLDQVDDRPRFVRNLGDQDDVRAAGDPRVERDPAGVAPHHFQDHHPVVALGRRVEAVHGLGRHGHRGLKAERVVGGLEVIVDGLRHGDHRDAEVAEALGDLERAVAADGNDAVDAELGNVRHDLGRTILRAAPSVRVFEGIAAVRRAQQCAPFGKDAADALQRQRHDRLREQSLETELDSDHLEVVFADQRARGRADDSIESRTVAAAGKESDSLHGRRRYRNRLAVGGWRARSHSRSHG